MRATVGKTAAAVAVPFALRSGDTCGQGTRCRRMWGHDARSALEVETRCVMLRALSALPSCPPPVGTCPRPSFCVSSAYLCLSVSICGSLCRPPFAVVANSALSPPPPVSGRSVPCRRLRQPTWSDGVLRAVPPPSGDRMRRAVRHESDCGRTAKARRMSVRGRRCARGRTQRLRRSRGRRLRGACAPPHYPRP